MELCHLRWRRASNSAACHALLADLSLSAARKYHARRSRASDALDEHGFRPFFAVDDDSVQWSRPILELDVHAGSRLP